MPIDFNTLNREAGAEIAQPSEAASAKPGTLYAVFSTAALALAVAGLCLSLHIVREKYSPKPVSVLCGPEVLANIAEISQKMNAISREVGGK